MKNLFLFICVLFLSCAPNGKDATTEQPAPPESPSTISPPVEQPEPVAPPQISDRAIDQVTDHFICYNSDDSELAISINFNKAGTALKIQYKGQAEAMTLKFLEEKIETEGAYPVITTRYQESYGSVSYGVYELTHSGNWDYAKYIRKSDGKIFNFTIDHEETVGDGDGYRTTPCFEEMGN